MPNRFLRNKEMLYKDLQREVLYCVLYDTGCTRLGCVGCPMGGYAAQRRELRRWPQYRKLYVSAFDDMLEARRRDCKLNHSSLWQSGEGVMQ